MKAISILEFNCGEFIKFSKIGMNYSIFIKVS